jgi:hypothetical protein
VSVPVIALAAYIDEQGAVYSTELLLRFPLSESGLRRSRAALRRLGIDFVENGRWSYYARADLLARYPTTSPPITSRNGGNGAESTPGDPDTEEEPMEEAPHIDPDTEEEPMEEAPHDLADVAALEVDAGTLAVAYTSGQRNEFELHAGTALEIGGQAVPVENLVELRRRRRRRRA